MFIDSHCHLFYPDFKEDIGAVIERAQNAGVNYFIVPATNQETAREAIHLAEKHPSIYAAVGFHPLDLEHFSDERLKIIEELSSHPKVIAIGEIGIDYFYDTSPREFQKEIFARQIGLAISKNLPIIVHTRDSVQDAVDIVVQYARKNPDWKKTGKRGVFHCFTGDVKQASILFESRFLVSFPGPVTFKKSAMPNVVKEIGLEHIMLETDSPFLTPVPHRGQRNEPAYIPLIAQKIAETLNVSLDDVAQKTTANAIAVFQLPIHQ